MFPKCARGKTAGANLALATCLGPRFPRIFVHRALSADHRLDESLALRSARDPADRLGRRRARGASAADPKVLRETRDGQGNVEEALRFINHASRILSDPDRRIRTTASWRDRGDSVPAEVQQAVAERAGRRPVRAPMSRDPSGDSRASASRPRDRRMPDPRAMSTIPD